MPDTIQSKELFGKAPRRNPEQFQFVRYRVDGPVARLTLDRPEHNLLNESMLRELADGIGALTEKSSVKLIVLDANGKIFSAGVDIGEYTAERAFSMLDAFHAACIAMVEASLVTLEELEFQESGLGEETVPRRDLNVKADRAAVRARRIAMEMVDEETGRFALNRMLVTP